MHRKKTELERYLLDKGWELSYKTYGGKHREKTLCYVYEKTFNDIMGDFRAKAMLNQKRDEIMAYYYEGVKEEFHSKASFMIEEARNSAVKEELRLATLPDINFDDEVVETVEAVEDVE